MRAAVVVEIDPPGRQFSHFVQTFKDVHIEDRLSICAVKSFDIAVLHRASGLDEIKFDSVLLCPVGDGYRCKFRAVVKSDPLRKATRFGDPVEHSDHSPAAEIEVDLDRQHLSSVVVDHIERPKPPSVAECVRHEIRRQGLVSLSRHLQRLRMSCRQPTLVLSPFVQPHLAVNTVHELVVPAMPLSP